MEPSQHDQEIAIEFPPFLRKYKDGRVERFFGTDIVPASLDPATGVTSKDITIDPETGVAARLYLPKLTNPDQQKLPILVYFHGGGFAVESAFSPTYQTYLNALVSEANILAISVNYRLAPEHPLPVPYNDSWAALKWVASHSSEEVNVEAWLKNHGDFDRVFLAGDSAGANIAHNMLMHVHELKGHELCGVKITGCVMIHSFFWGVDPIGSEAKEEEARGLVEKSWKFVCPNSSGTDDPLINPATDEKISGLGCDRVLVCVAEKDMFRDRGRFYYELLGKCGWGGVVELFETEDEDHAFHLFNPHCEKALAFLKKVSSFLNLEKNK